MRRLGWVAFTCMRDNPLNPCHFSQKQQPGIVNGIGLSDLGVGRPIRAIVEDPGEIADRGRRGGDIELAHLHFDKREDCACRSSLKSTIQIFWCLTHRAHVLVIVDAEDARKLVISPVIHVVVRCGSPKDGPLEVSPS